ncbi:MAG: hypothetical protein GY834_01855 [Bacteroidetes bacterium]|nr:hypothetical protein [Bacteroidota bacterium]
MEIVTVKYTKTGKVSLHPAFGPILITTKDKEEVVSMEIANRLVKMERAEIIEDEVENEDETIDEAEDNEDIGDKKWFNK